MHDKSTFHMVHPYMQHSFLPHESCSSHAFIPVAPMAPVDGVSVQ
jgi:hypothetical protein